MRAYIPEYHGSKVLCSVTHSQRETEEIIESGHRAMHIGDGRISVLPGGVEVDCSVQLQEKLRGLESSDVVTIDDQGFLTSYYLNASDSNAIFVGTRCNCNCQMCPYSEAARRGQRMLPTDFLKELIDYIPSDAPYLTVTGGEPTLLGADFLEMAEYLGRRLPETYIQFLTNGRAFSVANFGQAFRKLSRPNWRVAIPLHGPDAKLHDFITQSPSSFLQTVGGIKALEGGKAELEIRIVVSKLNYDRMLDIARFVVQNFQRITCVHFMGLEMLGNAAINAKNVWIDYITAFEYVKPAINFLVEHALDVELYNFPLCTVDRQYWGICARSISDYKVTFDDRCANCAVKDICGGFFNSTGHYGKLTIQPVEKNA